MNEVVVPNVKKKITWKPKLRVVVFWDFIVWREI